MESEVEDAAVGEVSTPAPSLRERIAQRERQMQHEDDRSIFVAVPGFEDMLGVLYRPMDVREMFKIETRHAKHKDDYEKNLFAIVDKMIVACEQIVEQTSRDEYRPTGYKWGARAARDLFGRELPDGATARQGVLAIFRDNEEALFDHFGEYEEQRSAARKPLDAALLGESVASSAAS